MENTQFLIQTYQIGFYVSLALTILGAVSAVFIFFRFDIRTIFAIRTGRAAQKTIRKMAEANAATGRLRPDELLYTSDGLTENKTPTASPAAAPAAQDAAQTVPLSSAPVPQAPAQPPRPPRTSGFAFTVTRQILLIHTDEQV